MNITTYLGSFAVCLLFYCGAVEAQQCPDIKILDSIEKNFEKAKKDNPASKTAPTTLGGNPK